MQSQNNNNNNFHKKRKKRRMIHPLISLQFRARKISTEKSKKLTVNLNPKKNLSLR
jgi:hypothetical protein